MKQSILLLCAVVVVSFITVGCEGIEGFRYSLRAKYGMQAEYEKILAERLARDIIYIKEPRTGFCFAGVSNTRSIAAVPCEKIPPELLVTPNLHLINK